MLIPMLALIVGAQTATPQVLPLWEKGVPGFESRRNEPEQAKDWWVKNINNPSLTIFKPEHPNGCAIIIAPGGGHNQLVFNAEGVDAATYLNTLGVTAFVLKYRLAREENSPYKLTECIPQDAHRAIRQVRSHATEFGIDPNRVGMLGFSAGGEVVSMVAYADPSGDKMLNDAIDQTSGKLNFQILVYPGPLGIPETVTSEAPPALFVTAIDDESAAKSIMGLLPKFREAKVSAEAHIFAQGGHGFNMGQRSTLATLKSWPQRMGDWLKDNGWLG